MPTTIVATEAQLNAAIRDADTVANQGAITIQVAGTLLENSDPIGINLAAGNTLLIGGIGGGTLDGAGLHRGLFAYSGTVTIQTLTIQNIKAFGGAGGLGGSGGGGGSRVGGGRGADGGFGGGLGAGGDVFVQAGGSLLIEGGSLSGGGVTAGAGNNGGTNGQAYGSYTLTASEADAAGNTGSAALAFTLDTTAPTAALTAVDPTANTAAAAVRYLLTTSGSVLGLSTGSFSVSQGGTLSGAAVIGVMQQDSTHVLVTVSTGTGNGALGLSLAAAGSGVADTAGNVLAADVAGPAYAVVHTPAFNVLDTTTGQQTSVPGDAYTGPVAGLQYQYINTTSENLNVAAGLPNAFIHTGSGFDAIDVSVVGGTNVLDGGGRVQLPGRWHGRRQPRHVLCGRPQPGGRHLEHDRELPPGQRGDGVGHHTAGFCAAMGGWPGCCGLHRPDAARDGGGPAYGVADPHRLQRGRPVQRTAEHLVRHRGRQQLPQHPCCELRGIVTLIGR